MNTLYGRQSGFLLIRSPASQKPRKRVCFRGLFSQVRVGYNQFRTSMKETRKTDTMLQAGLNGAGYRGRAEERKKEYEDS
jgi:hypothetical protein